MKRHRFTKSQLLDAMTVVDAQPHYKQRNLPVEIIFLLALVNLFRGRGIIFNWIQHGPDIKLDQPARWWRERDHGDLIVEQGIDIKV
jgi:hypothetical protein